MGDSRSHGDDLRGASRLAVDATLGVTRLVEDMHRTIASGPAVLGRPLAGPARLLTRLMYGQVLGVTELVGAGLDLALEELAPALGASEPGSERAAVLAAVNGVLGDYLEASGNPLALDLTLRRVPPVSGRLLVLVHGSCMNDAQWERGGHDHGAALSRELGLTPVYVRYNSGRHVSTNGRELAAQLEELVRSWPVPVEEIAVLGHSMGGLVARSAVHVAEDQGHTWRGHLRALATLGTPHHGSPLERGGSWVDVLIGVSPYSAPLARLGRIRSAGVTDLRYGNVLDAHWEGRERFGPSADPRTPLPLPEGVACFAVAGDLLGRGLGDGLVSVASALGRHRRPELALAFPAEHTWVGDGLSHLDLLNHPEVYARLRGWLA